MNRLRTQATELMRDAASVLRYAKLVVSYREGNVLGITGDIASQSDFDSFVELGRHAGFLVLADELFIGKSEGDVKGSSR